MAMFGSASVFDQVSLKSLADYYVRAGFVLLLLYMLGLSVSKMNLVLVALMWAALSAFVALSIEYHVVIRKARRQLSYENEGLSAKVNNGRLISFIFAFVTSAASVGCLVLQSPWWSVFEWLTLVGVCLVMPFVSVAAYRFCSREFQGQFRIERSIRFSCLFVGVIACIAYAVVSLSNSGIDTYDTFLQALTCTSNMLDDSDSALLSEAGRLVWFTNAGISFGFSQAQSACGEFLLLVVVFSLLSIGAFLGVSSLFGLCLLPLLEVRKIFISVASINEPSGSKPSMEKRFVLGSIALPLVLVASFLYAEQLCRVAVDGVAYSYSQSIVRSAAGALAYEVDGAIYDKGKMDELLLSRAIDGDLQEAAKERLHLENVLSNAYDACKNNLHSYLDWFYALKQADRDKVASLSDKQKANTEAKERFIELVIGDSFAEVKPSIERYYSVVDDACASISDSLSECQLYGVPEWLIDSKECPEQLNEMLSSFDVLCQATNWATEGSAGAADETSADFSALLYENVSGIQAYKMMVERIQEEGAAAESAFWFFSLPDIDSEDNRDWYYGDFAAAFEDSHDCALELLNLA